MSFATEADLRVISAISGWEVWEDVPMLTDSGWDGLSRKVVGHASSEDDALASWPVGTAISGMNMWVANAKARCLGADIYAVELSCKGLFAERPLKVSGRSATEQQQGDAILGPDWTGAQRAVVKEAAPSVNIEYIIIGGEPPTNLVGTNGTPDYAPAVRASVWATVADPLYHFPAGWVFDGIDWEYGPGNHACLVKEAWNYIFEISI